MIEENFASIEMAYEIIEQSISKRFFDKIQDKYTENLNLRSIPGEKSAKYARISKLRVEVLKKRA